MSWTITPRYLGRVITSAQVFATFGGGGRSANYAVEYSDDTINWTQAFAGVMSASGCGLFTGSNPGTGNYGPHRYWRYVVGSPVNSHHPRVSRIILVEGSSSYNIYVNTADNCGDSGLIPNFQGSQSIFAYTF